MEKIENTIIHYKTLSKAAGKPYAWKGCACMAIDSFTRHSTMLYIDFIRKYIKKWFHSYVEAFCEREKNGAAKKFDARCDFYGKSPVWVCWLQGVEKMPLVVRACYENLLKQVPADKATVILVTMENLSQYVTLSATVLQKINEKSYSLTNLSDLLHVTLLAAYGGMWIDATVFVGRPIDPLLFQKEFYFQKTKTKFFVQRFVTQSRWASWFMVCQKDFVLFRFTAEMLERYYENSLGILDYYLIDYLMKLAYRIFPQVKRQIDAVPLNNIRAFDLVPILNEARDEQKVAKFFEDTPFCKPTYKYSYACSLPDGRETNYAYFISKHLDD